MTPPPLRTSIPSLLCLLGLCCASTASAQTATDPTYLSPQLKELLNGLNASSSLAPPVPQAAASTATDTAVAPVAPPPRIRLQGLVIRDDRSGIALLTSEKDRVMVALNRTRLTEIRFTIAGEPYEVIDFHARGVALRNVRTGETIYVY